MVEVSKADWKLFRKRVPEWQERYMEKLNKEYIELLQSDTDASDNIFTVNCEYMCS